MLNSYSKYLTGVFILCFSFMAKAQDSLSLYNTIVNQLNQFRILNDDFYRNPANMSDYSNYSFSNIRLNYQSLKNESYLLQQGQSHQQINLQTSSYKATKNNLTLWGGASYNSRKTKNVQWNNNIDLERINPIVIADSIGGTMNLQTYDFNGGFAKKIKKFTFGTQLQYQASLNYKTQDPRPKNVTSDLNISFGTNYSLNDNYKIGLAAGINRYIQTATVTFSSEVQRTALYQMNGLGTYNFYFSNKSENAVYTDFNHNYLLTFGSKDQLFSITAGVVFGDLKKDISLSGNNSAYETNRISSQKSFANIYKIFRIKDHYNIGAKINYTKIDKLGTDVFYTNNTNIVTKLLEKESYNFTNTNLTFSLIFQYQKNGSSVFIQPFYSATQTSESKYDIDANQNFNHHIIGSKLFYLQQLNSKNALSLNASLYRRTLKNTPNNLILTPHIGINEWLLSDFNLMKTNYYAIETEIRYDKKLFTKQSIYAIFALDYHVYSNKTTNIQSILSLGITF